MNIIKLNNLMEQELFTCEKSEKKAEYIIRVLFLESETYVGRIALKDNLIFKMELWGESSNEFVNRFVLENKELIHSEVNGYLGLSLSDTSLYKEFSDLSELELVSGLDREGYQNHLNEKRIARMRAFSTEEIHERIEELLTISIERRREGKVASAMRHENMILDWKFILEERNLGIAL